MNFIIASSNQDKIKEIKEILADSMFEIHSMNEYAKFDDIIENGDTFEANALIKARAVHSVTGGYVMADDSGLSINALDGAPGIHSARFISENANYQEKIQKIWDMLDLSGNPDKTAIFVCAIAVIRPDGSEFTVRGECHGMIHNCIEGENGFGYDPIFFYPDLNMTTASMDRDVKNSISHRGIALRKMAEILMKELTIDS